MPLTSHIRRRLAVIVLILVGILIGPWITAADEFRLPATPGSATPLAQHGSLADEAAGDRDPLLYEAVLPDQRERIYERTAGTLSRYRIESRLTPSAAGEPATLTGSIALRYVNSFSSPTSEVHFRLYPNAPAYNEAEMTVPVVSAAGRELATQLSVEDTVLTVGLPSPLAPGQAIDLELAYSAVVPVRPMGTFGIFAVSPEGTTVTLGHWFPLLAGIDGFGWSLNPVSRNGDPIFSNVALFDIRLSTPRGWTVAAPGVEVGRVSRGELETRHFVTGPVRDVAIVVSDHLKLVSHEVNGITVRSFFRPEHRESGEAVLEYGSSALRVFGELLVPYPYRQMTLVEVELHGAGGMEFPQLMLMGTTLYDGEHPTNEHYLEFVTAHEVGHQWFYGLVGSNQHLAAYIDEGLVEYLSTDVYFTAVQGEQAGQQQFGLEVLLWYLGALEARGDMMVDQPTDSFPNSAVYGAAVYAKAAIGFAEIHDLLGDEAFFTALHRYAVAHEFGIGTPEALFAAFAEASPRDVSTVWREWFETESGRERFNSEDLDELRVELGLR